MDFQRGSRRTRWRHLDEDVAVVRRPHVPKLMHLAGLSPKDSGLVGWVAFCIFQVELRRWLTTKDFDIDD